MAILTEDNRTSELTTDGVETEFDFAMLIHADSEVQVWYEPDGGEYELLTLDTDYTVSFIEDGGTVTTIGGSSPRATGKILIIRHIELTQETNWLYNDNHTEQQHQDDFDRSVMRDLQIQEQLDRTLLLETSSDTTGLTIPEPESGKFLRWKTDLSGLENITATDASLNTISDIAYDATTWNNNLDGATKNVLRDEIESMDYAFVSANDGATDITAAQLEELSDGSDTGLHIHDQFYYTKDEVNDIVEGNTFDFFLNNTNSDISAPIQYFVMDPTETGEAESTFSDTITNDAFLIDSWATSTSEPTFSALVSGIYSFHIHAETTTGANVGTVRLYWELYRRTHPGGAETLLITSEQSNILVGAELEYDIHGTLATDVMLDATDRIVLKVYANIEVSRPTDPLVTLTAEGTTAAHFEVVTTITAFDDRYVEVAGDTMTGNLAMGGNNITGITNLSMTGLFTISGAGIISPGGTGLDIEALGDMLLIADDDITLEASTGDIFIFAENNITLATDDIIFDALENITLDADNGNISFGANDIILDADNDITLTLGDTSGVNKVIIKDAGAGVVATIDSDGGIVGTTFNSGTLSGNNSGDQSAGDFSHNSLAGLNAGTTFEHLTQTQKNLLHTQGTDTTLGTLAGNILFDNDARTIGSATINNLLVLGNTGLTVNGTIGSGAITSTGDATAGKLIINQTEDDIALQLNGFDDQNGANIQLGTRSDGNHLLRATGQLAFRMNGVNADVIIINSNSLIFADNKRFQLGDGGDTASFLWSTDQTNNALMLGLDDYSSARTPSRSMIVCDEGDMSFNFAHGNQTNPTIFIHSLAQSTTEWLSLTHDGTDGIIGVGAGRIKTIGGLEPDRFYPRKLTQNDRPAAGTGATQIDTGEMVIWYEDDDDNTAELVYRDASKGILFIEFNGP